MACAVQKIRPGKLAIQSGSRILVPWLVFGEVAGMSGQVLCDCNKKLFSANARSLCKTGGGEGRICIAREKRGLT